MLDLKMEDGNTLQMVVTKGKTTLKFNILL